MKYLLDFFPTHINVASAHGSANIMALNHELGNLKQSLEERDARIRSLREDLDAAGAMQVRLNAGLATSQGHVNDLMSQNAKLDSQIHTSEQENASLKRHRDILVVSMQELQSKLDASETEKTQVLFSCFVFPAYHAQLSQFDTCCIA